MGTDEMRNVNEMFSDYENQNNEDGKVKKFDNILSKFFKPKNNKELFRLLPPNKNITYVSNTCCKSTISNLINQYTKLIQIAA